MEEQEVLGEAQAVLVLFPIIVALAILPIILVVLVDYMVAVLATVMLDKAIPVVLFA